MTGETSGFGNRFWWRQYHGPYTAAQRIFDSCFGVLAPVLCVVFDPAVFKGMGSGFIGQFRLLSYIEIAIGVTALSYFLLRRRPSLCLAGVLWGGAAFSVMLGVAILPLTLLGLLILVGVFGLTPFVSGFAFSRSAYRCWSECQMRNARARALRIVVLSAVLTVLVPGGIQSSLAYAEDRTIASVTKGSDAEFKHTLAMLRYIGWAMNGDRVVEEYQHTSDANQRSRLARAYQAIAGRNIEERLAELAD